MAKQEKKKISRSLVISLIVIVVVAALIITYTKQNRNIGGERDEYGCLAAAGYSYDSDIGACTKSWEITEENDKRAAEIAVESTGEEGLTVVSLTDAKCVGCYLVELEKDSNINEIVVYNWKARTKEISAEECFSFGARLVKESDGCAEDETNFGNVISFDYPKICCVA